ncbi:response regulator [Flavobacterium cerinum]|uniref:Response regulator n=1 Tax=Flavobacterium cerinum TaxID=2502784 RepID=A0A3S3TZU9_9FLAO|nr:response regulator [Flavobacterium cerinum]RWW99680.1 response regulator [Flavobacterium cerinum]
MSIRSCFLIDDDDDDREIFALALENAHGVSRCIMAKNGVDAVKIVNEADFIPTYIFIDLNMPLMSGKECLLALKKSRLSSVPVIVYTTSSNCKDVEETKKLGAAHYLVKPTSVTALTGILSDIFSGITLPYYLYTEV